jgi:hypothetical protein
VGCWLGVSSDDFQTDLNTIPRRAIGLKLFLDPELAEGVLPYQNTLATPSNFDVAGICKTMFGKGHVGCSSVMR